MLHWPFKCRPISLPLMAEAKAAFDDDAQAEWTQLFFPAESDLGRNYQIMSALMIAIITCVANEILIRPTIKGMNHELETTNDNYYQHHFQNRLDADPIQLEPHSMSPNPWSSTPKHEFRARWSLTIFTPIVWPTSSRRLAKIPTDYPESLDDPGPGAETQLKY